MLWIIGIILIVVIIILGIGWYISAPKYEGAENDHFEGGKFHNLSSVEAQGFSGVFKWYANRDEGPWEYVDTAQYGLKPPASSEIIRITFINHATFLIQVAGVNILTDPVYSERASPFQWVGPKRMRPPGIRFEDLPKIEIVLISHNHYDHLDEMTVKKLSRRDDPQFIVPLGVSAYLNRLGITKSTDYDWWGRKKINRLLSITCVPAQHFSGRGTFDRDATLWAGYVIESTDGKVYFAGDTGYDRAVFRGIGDKLGPIDVSLIPIGAYLPKWFMSPIHISPEEAVQVHKDVQSKQSIGIHFGTFPLADDGQHRPVEDLQKAKEEQNLADDEFIILDEGEGRTF